jgi:hypothetical protein
MPEVIARPFGNALASVFVEGKNEIAFTKTSFMLSRMDRLQFLQWGRSP